MSSALVSTVTDASVESAPANALSEPPTRSMLSAICCADRVAVPCRSSEAVIAARPALSAGWLLDPAPGNINVTATIGWR